MKLDEKTILDRLPDYDDFMTLAEQIERYSLLKSKVDIDIKTREAELVRKVTTDVAYFQNGKAPSMTMIESTYQYSGLEGELIPLRLQLAEYSATVEKLKATMEIYKTWVSIWQSLNSNARAARL